MHFCMDEVRAIVAVAPIVGAVFWWFVSNVRWAWRFAVQRIARR